MSSLKDATEVKLLEELICKIGKGGKTSFSLALNLNANLFLDKT